MRIAIRLYMMHNLIIRFVHYNQFREGSVRGYGIRVKQSIEGSDSWVDDPIMRHIISLHVKKEEDEKTHTFWPLILHTKGQYYILVLPLVEPHHLKSYKTLSTRSDCGNGVAVDENGNLSSLLLQLPSITGYGKFLEFFFLHISHFNPLFQY